MGNTNKLEIHYYFDDVNKHSMDAMIKNKADLDVLLIVKELGELLNIEFEVQTQALDEGGLVEYLQFLSDTELVAYLITILTFIFSVYVYCDGSEARDLEKQERKLSIEEKELNLKKLRQEFTLVDNEEKAKIFTNKLLFLSPKIIAKRTSYFKNIQQQSDISKISYSLKGQNSDLSFSERVIERKFFSKMIIEPKNPKPDLYEKVEVEIVSPILKKQNKSKWKVVFNNDLIQFSVSDQNFIDDVSIGKISFTSNTILVCDLEVIKKINEIGEEVITSYKVNYVYEYTNDGGSSSSEVKPKVRKKIKQEFDQGELFV